MRNIIIGIIILLAGYLIIDHYTDFAFLNPNPEETVNLGSELESEIEPETELEPSEENIRVPSRFACVGEYCDGSMESDDYLEKYTVLSIPLIKDGGTIGCGADLFFAPHAVNKTVTPLDATYELLFDIKPTPEIPEDGFRNIVGVYDRLFYDHVTLTDGTAKVYLTGNMYGPGHCSIPELRAQISQAALHFDTVDTVEVYLNNEIYDWCEQDLSDGEGPCPENPQLWIDSE